MKAKQVRLLGALILPLSVALCMSNGCRSAKPPINREQAVAIARREAVQRGWSELEVRSANLEDGRWLVTLERMPKVYGGHATVEIPKAGQVRWIAGK